MAQSLTLAATSTITRQLTISFLLPKRLLSTPSITHPPPISSLLFSRRPLAPLSHAVNRSGNSAYSPLNSGSNFSDRPLFPGCDYEHWLIVMDKPGGEGATKQEMIDCYIKTLAKVVGSEEEAKKKIYNVSCERYFGFGCEIDEETSNKLEGLPGVLFVLPDSYVDPEYKDYGGNCIWMLSSRKFVKDNLQSKVDTLLDSIKWDDKGLAVAIAQNVDTGAILMQGFVNRDALATTISSRKATFFSRSRAALWTKGETSKNFINIHDIFVDCDRDSIIYLGKPDGPTCHTGSETCYFTSISDVLKEQEVEENHLPLTTLYSLESIISERESELAGQHGKPSWTKRLLLDENLLCSKIREEADELCRTLEEKEDNSRTASEMADVIYHAMVLLRRKDVKIENVLEVLRQRFSQSGIEEKLSRVTT